MTATAYQEGLVAHAGHKLRVYNPYVLAAAQWDLGWVARQKEQLIADGKENDAERITPFKDWVGDHIRC